MIFLIIPTLIKKLYAKNHRLCDEIFHHFDHRACCSCFCETWSCKSFYRMDKDYCRSSWELELSCCFSKRDDREFPCFMNNSSMTKYTAYRRMIFLRKWYSEAFACYMFSKSLSNCLKLCMICFMKKIWEKILPAVWIVVWYRWNWSWVSRKMNKKMVTHMNSFVKVSQSRSRFYSIHRRKYGDEKS